MNEERTEERPRVIEQRDDLQNHGTNKEKSTELEDMRKKRDDCNIDIGISNELFSEPNNQKQTKLMFNLPKRKYLLLPQLNTARIKMKSTIILSNHSLCSSINHCIMKR